MPWVEISQAAFTMGISERTIRNWIKSGKINAKTESGKRMVEIPDEELHASSGPEAEFADGERFSEQDGDGETSLGTQKRLEVALLECGRVKGTLASQERIMETLSSNIAELTAKLQRSQNTTWKVLILAVVVGAVGVLALVAQHSFNRSDIDQQRLAHKDELGKLEEKVWMKTEEFHKKQEEMLAKREQTEARLRQEKQEEIKEVRAQLNALHTQSIEALRKSWQERLDEKSAMVAELRSKLEERSAKVIKLEAAEEQLQKQVDELKETAGRQALQLEKLEEYKSQVAELQATLIEERNRNLRRSE